MTRDEEEANDILYNIGRKERDFRTLMTPSFERLFSIEADYEKKSIYDLFQINIKELPAYKFVDLGVSSDNGKEFNAYRTQFDYLECDIFNVIEVHKFNDGYIDVYFKREDLPLVELENLIRLTNTLFHLYGNALDGGIFTKDDFENFCNMHFFRMWVTEDFNIAFTGQLDYDEETYLLISFNKGQTNFESTKPIKNQH